MNKNITRITISIIVVEVKDAPRLSTTLYSSRSLGKLINADTNRAMPNMVDCFTFLMFKTKKSISELWNGKLVKIYYLMCLILNKKEAAQPCKTTSKNKSY